MISFQSDLEYDPALYQRDRGEADWDRQSVTSVAILSDGPKSNYAASETSKNWAYENYLANGPAGASEIELNQFEAMQAPLLDYRTIGMNQDALQSTRSLTPSLPQNTLQRSHSPSPLYISTDDLNQSPVDPPPVQHQRQPSGTLLANQQIRSSSPGPQSAMGQYRYPPRPHSRQNSGFAGSSQPYSPQQSPQHNRQLSGNMLGQGGRQSPGPYQAYTGRHSPGPYQSYSSQVSPQQARPMSGNILSGTPPPTYIPPPPGLQSVQQQYYHQSQQSMSSSGHSSTAGRGPRGGY